MSKKQKITDPDLIKGLNSFFDLAYEDYNSIFLTEAELKSIIFSNQINFHTSFDYRKCSVKYCRNKAVKSHLFQESVLKKCATDGHLLSPYFDYKKQKVELKKIGVNKALTFSGFCTKHESMFDYEKHESLKYEHQVRLIIYKSICYNHVFWDIAYKKSKDSFNKVIERKQERFDHIIQEQYFDHFKNQGLSIKGVMFQDPRQPHLEALLKHRRKLVVESLNFKNLLWEDIKAGEDKNLKFYVIYIDKLIPILFSYFGELTLNKPFKDFSQPICYIIHPFNNQTQIIFCTTLNQFQDLKNFLERLKIGQILNLMLQSLVYVSDNWLVNPEFYSKYYPEDLKKIINEAISLPIDKRD